jgi:RNA polymerase sigma-70 factor (ECF subfamily)
MRPSPEPSEQEVSDEALLAGLASGDAAATVAFVRRYERRLYGLAYSLLGDAGLAEDVAQEALLRAWRHAQVFDPRRGSVAKWLLTVTRNLAIDTMRLRRASSIPPVALAALTGADVRAEQPFETADRLSELRSALRELPVAQSRALVLSGLYGCTADEVAEHEAVPSGTAKSRIRAGLAKLHQRLAAADEESA